MKKSIHININPEGFEGDSFMDHLLETANKIMEFIKQQTSTE